MGKGLAFDKLLLFGDSITQDAFKQDHGFCVGAGLQDHYTRRLDVVNRGFSGYNSDHGAAMIDKIIEIETTSFSKIALMVVFFGTNDSVVPLHFQHVPLPRFKDNLRAIGLAAKEAGIPVVMVGPAPFSVNAWAAVRPEQADERSTQRHREYCDAVVEVGAELGVPVVGLWYEIMAEIGWRESEQTLESETKMKTSGLLEQYFWDGLHFRGPAYEVEFKGILKAIQGRYQHLEAEKMQIQLPPYDGIPSLDFLKGEL